MSEITKAQYLKPVKKKPGSITLWLIYFLSMTLLVVSCKVSGEDLPTATPSPAPASGTIQGIVWHDECVNAEVAGAHSAGCTVSLGLGELIANGIREPDEQGIADVEVSLGAGPCPSTGIVRTTTSTNGGYVFSALPSGVYCVSISDSDLLPGFWTFPPAEDGPGNGMSTIALGTDEKREHINFGWDYQALPILPTLTPRPTIEPSPTPSCEDAAAFVGDTSIPDGTRFDGGESFTKTWRLSNIGTCSWTTDYDVVLISGYALGSVGSVSLAGETLPGQTIDISVDMRAPTNKGSYKSVWMLRNSTGDVFGIGEDATSPFWVQIVVGPEPEPDITAWRGEYFDNGQLAGEPYLVRNDQEIDFNWRHGAPDDDLPSDNFSARWTRTLEFRDAIYRFRLTMDDGATLWVDDRLVIDEWWLGTTREVSVDLAMKKGKHDLRIEYYEKSGQAHIEFQWKKLKQPSYAGWQAKYWFNRKLNSGWALVRSDGNIDFDWGKGSPALGIPSDSFSAQWQRTVEFDPGVYRLFARADDGIRASIDGVLIMDEWHDSKGNEQYSVDVTLSGSHALQVEYYERKGNAEIKFWWEFLSEPNQAPIAADDVYSTPAEGELVVPAPGLLSNDSDPDGDEITPLLETEPDHGTVTLQLDGAFTYTPEAGFSGTDAFTYFVSDGIVNSNLADVTITVIKANTPPSAADDTYETIVDQILNVLEPGVLINDTDAENDPLQAVLESPASFGDVVLNADGSFTYQPQTGFSGTDSFQYIANDGSSNSNTATVTIAVAATNEPPIAAGDAYSVNEDEILNIGAPGVLTNDNDPEGQTLVALLVDSPSNGRIVLSSDGAFQYTPQPDFHGLDSFSYTANDGQLDSNLAIVTLTVDPMNDTPQAVDDSASTEGDTPIDIPVLANDSGLGDQPVTITLETLPGEGTAEVVGNQIHYTPFGGVSETDSFTYTVTDADGESSTASVSISLVWIKP